MEGGEWNAEQVEALVGIWGEIFDEERAHEGQYDQWILRSYLTQKGLDKVDVHLHLQRGIRCCAWLDGKENCPQRCGAHIPSSSTLDQHA